MPNMNVLSLTVKTVMASVKDRQTDGLTARVITIGHLQVIIGALSQKSNKMANNQRILYDYKLIVAGMASFQNYRLLRYPFNCHQYLY